MCSYITFLRKFSENEMKKMKKKGKKRRHTVQRNKYHGRLQEKKSTI